MSRPYEHGFILSLLLIAIVSLLWLFSPFIPALFFAMLMAIASFSRYQKLQQRLSKTWASITMTSLVTVVLILPLGYILLVSGLEISMLIQNINTQFDFAHINQLLQSTVAGLPLSDSMQATLSASIHNNLEPFLLSVKDFSIDILSGIVSLSSNFALFVLIVIFSLFYFYIDGQEIVKKIKHLTPLENRLDDVLLQEFSSLSITLVGSVFTVALLQGAVFAIGAMLAGMPALYFGIAMALASFIPVLGGLIIWLPLSLYLYAQGQITEALIIVAFGALIVGVVIDHFVRPIITQKYASQSHGGGALDHTLITVLSTLAGIIQFGILGLFIGPIIAAMAISIFDVYAIKYSETLDKS